MCVCVCVCVCVRSGVVCIINVSWYEQSITMKWGGGGKAVEPRTPSGWNSAKYKMISESLQLLLRRSIVLLSASPTHGFYHQMWQTAPALTVCRWGCRIWWEPRCCKCRQEAWGWREAAAACSGQVWWNRGWKMRVGESYYPSFHKRGWKTSVCVSHTTPHSIREAETSVCVSHTTPHSIREAETSVCVSHTTPHSIRQAERQVSVCHTTPHSIREAERQVSVWVILPLIP